jgi:hypothetical protein
MAEIKVREDGYVIGLSREQLTEMLKKNPQAAEAIQYLEDGLSYLSYAKLGSDRGTNNPEDDYKTGIGFVMSALDTLCGNIEL